MQPTQPTSCQTIHDLSVLDDDLWNIEPINSDEPSNFELMPIPTTPSIRSFASDAEGDVWPSNIPATLGDTSGEPTTADLPEGDLVSHNPLTHQGEMSGEGSMPVSLSPVYPFSEIELLGHKV